MRNKRKNQNDTCKSNFDAAHQLWSSNLGPFQVEHLKFLGEEYSFSVAGGDLLLIDSHWYVTHCGLLRLATKKKCSGIHVRAVPEFCDATSCRWAFEATVYKSRTCRGFGGFGDADLNNTSSLVRGAEMRVAETRAVNRALRKAYGIGLCSVEEIGSSSGPLGPVAQAKKQPKTSQVADGNGRHLRDRLLVLIRQQKLDGSLVKAYAADFCGVRTLREASKEQVQEFVNHLAEYAAHDREGLLCQLNSYAPKQESAA